MVEAWLRTDMALDQINNDILFALANYDPTRNKFYQEYQSVYDLNEVYRHGVSAVHHHLAQTEKGSKQLFARINRKYTVKRLPFERVPHARSRERISIVEIPARVKHKSMATNLTAIIKYTDNIFRQRAGFKAKLRGFEIPQGWRDVLETQFEIKPEPIVIDFLRVDDISKRSESVRMRLIAEMDDTETTETRHVVAQDNTDETTPVSNEQAIRYHSLFTMFEQNDGQVTSTQLQAWFESTFINVLVDEFNEWAFEHIGDTPIITTGDGYYCLLKEYRDDVALLFEDNL